MTARLRISNRQARQLWLNGQGLGPTPTGPLNLAKMIRDLGFVQLDSIQVVARAHHHILWSRNQNYREPMLDRLLGEDRVIFEHFTHDASVLPMEFLPMWQRQFQRLQAKLDRQGWLKNLPDASERDQIKARIREEGALSTAAFDTKIQGKKEMWSRPPHKRALDYMWFGGELATCHRVNFQKFYNLPERVFPDQFRSAETSEADQVAWLCDAALHRMGFGSPGEVQKFWDAVDRKEALDWAEGNRDLIPIEIEAHDGNWVSCLGAPDIEARLANLTPPTSRLRILNPFDPAIRDRIRLERLFGFEYRVEMFVPAQQRVWGYYVFPLLEGDRFVGRIDLKADRKASTLTIRNLWHEPKVRWTAARFEKLDAELAHLARFIGVGTVIPTAAKDF